MRLVASPGGAAANLSAGSIAPCPSQSLMSSFQAHQLAQTMAQGPTHTSTRRTARVNRKSRLNRLRHSQESLSRTAKKPYKQIRGVKRHAQQPRKPPPPPLPSTLTHIHWGVFNHASRPGPFKNIYRYTLSDGFEGDGILAAPDNSQDVVAGQARHPDPLHLQQ